MGIHSFRVPSGNRSSALCTFLPSPGAPTPVPPAAIAARATSTSALNVALAWLLRSSLVCHIDDRSHVTVRATHAPRRPNRLSTHAGTHQVGRCHARAAQYKKTLDLRGKGMPVTCRNAGNDGGKHEDGAGKSFTRSRQRPESGHVRWVGSGSRVCGGWGPGRSAVHTDGALAHRSVFRE